MTEQIHDITLRVNGAPRTANVPARRLLSDALRHDLGLTGTHVGCEHGVCGCCTVLLDGKPVRSCLMFAVSAQNHDITTVEGLNRPDGGLHPIQQAFQECHGLQCGFCTPGFLMSVHGLLASNPSPTDDDIVEGISGNLCRCTGYQNIIAAVQRASEILAHPDSELRGVDRDHEEHGDGETSPRSRGQPVPYGDDGGISTPGETASGATSGGSGQ